MAPILIFDYMVEISFKSAVLDMRKNRFHIEDDFQDNLRIQNFLVTRAVKRKKSMLTKGFIVIIITEFRSCPELLLLCSTRTESWVTALRTYIQTADNQTIKQSSS